MNTPPPPGPTGGQTKPDKPTPGLPPALKWIGIVVISILCIAFIVNIIVFLIAAFPLTVVGVPIGAVIIWIFRAALIDIFKKKK